MRPQRGAGRKAAAGTAKALRGQPQAPVLADVAATFGGAVRACWGRVFAVGAAVWAGFGALVLHYLGVIG